MLLGNGDGTFQPYYSADQHVALAVLPNGSATPDFIYADQGLDRVVVDYASGQTSVVADHSSGLLAPGAVALADLNGDGIPDLIVANSGSNNVLVYPGLGNGQFGPELNGGNGFFTGTDPVGITVANLNGRPDLVIANEGSNDVSILLNVADGGRRLHVRARAPAPGRPRADVDGGRGCHRRSVPRPPGQRQRLEPGPALARRGRRLLRRPGPHDLFRGERCPARSWSAPSRRGRGRRS